MEEEDEPEASQPAKAESTNGGEAENADTMNGAVDEGTQVDVDSRESTKPTSRGASEGRSMALRENESLKAKMRIMEKKRQEDREKFKAMEGLQADKERFENIIQVLQKKLKTSQQELLELRDQFATVQSQTSDVVDRSGEHESEIELLTLDKEMAEERAETYKTELEALKMKHEEQELETEILREENRELGSVMSPEEKASAGWLQMERERDRLRDALVLLRDMTQQSEADMRSQLKELQQDASSAESLRRDFEDTTTKLSKAEATNRHLMEQLEAAESNDEINMALEQEKEVNAGLILDLKQQLQELQDEAQIGAELEEFHISAEKELQAQLDDTQAVLFERQQQNAGQERSIQDLEYTLTKFRDVVSGLQSDIDDLRRTREIGEAEANEMSSKSRAMMDLNLQLQNSAAKSQMKNVDRELERIQGEETLQHMSMLRLFVTETYEAEKAPMLALLCAKRIKSKASLVVFLLRDRIRDRPHLFDDDPFAVFEVIEKLTRIAELSGQWVNFMSSCDVSTFMRMTGVAQDLDPVEKAVTGWVQMLRQDEMGSDGPEHLARMIGVLQDLREKFIVNSTLNKSSVLVMDTSLVTAYLENSAGELSMTLNALQARLGKPTDENEESLHFHKKIDSLVSKIRTIRFQASRARQLLEDMQAQSTCLTEPNWTFFDEAVTSALDASSMIRRVNKAAWIAATDDETNAELSYVSISDVITSALQSTSNEGQDVFSVLTDKLEQLHAQVDNLYAKCQDSTLTSTFEKPSSPPWVIRATDLKSRKIILPELQEELSRLKTRLQDQVVSLAGKDRQLEEQQIQIEVLESRNKETKANAGTLHQLEQDLASTKKARQELDQQLQATKDEIATWKQDHADQAEASKLSDLPGASSDLLSSQDQTVLLETKVQNTQLTTEILSLQAAVRHLESQLRYAKLSVSDIRLQSREMAWLNPANLTTGTAQDKQTKSKQQVAKREADAVLEKLVRLGQSVKPVVLRPLVSSTKPLADADEEIKGQVPLGDHSKPKTSSVSMWRPRKETARYQALVQREKVVRWERERDDFVRRVRLVRGGKEARTKVGGKDPGARDNKGVGAGTYSLPILEHGKAVEAEATDVAVLNTHV